MAYRMWVGGAILVISYCMWVGGAILAILRTVWKFSQPMGGKRKLQKKTI